MSLTLGLGIASVRVLLGLVGVGYSLCKADFGEGAKVSNEILKSVVGETAGGLAYDFLKGGGESALKRIADSLQQGDSEHLNHDLQRAALQISREVGDRANEGMVLGNIGATYDELGDKQKALEYYEQGLQIHRDVGNRVDEGFVLSNKGLAKFDLGEKEEGIRLLEQALEIARQVEDKMREAYLSKKLELMKGHGDDAPFVRLSRSIWRKAKRWM